MYGILNTLTHHVGKGAHGVVGHAVWHELHHLTKIWGAGEAHVREAICTVETKAVTVHAIPNPAD